eukprot:GHVU01216510.1.p1 GENE.GHVU01216510.1~~GHVU01216510.1.p1  ORF type:complete len:125 (+),score=7.36 GHVU01216510.1:344-718(+)
MGDSCRHSSEQPSRRWDVCNSGSAHGGTSIRSKWFRISVCLVLTTLVGPLPILSPRVAEAHPLPGIDHKVYQRYERVPIYYGTMTSPLKQQQLQLQQQLPAAAASGETSESVVRESGNPCEIAM